VSDFDDEIMEEIQDAMEASVHVHFRDDCVEVVIYRVNVSLGVEIGQGEVAVLVQALKSCVDTCEVSDCDAYLHLSSGIGMPEGLSAEAAQKHRENYVGLGISFQRDGSTLWAIIERQRLIRLLLEGCSSVNDPTSPQPSSKCN